MKRIAESLLLILLSSPVYSEISETSFRETLREIENFMAPHLQNDLGLKLGGGIQTVWIPRTSLPIALSHARVLPQDHEVHIQIDGSFAQKPQANRAAFTLIVFHEIGHIYRDRPDSLTLIKEGQADYFASQYAYRFAFQSVQQELSFDGIPNYLMEQCRSKTLEDNRSFRSCLEVSSGIASYARVHNVDMNTLYDSEDRDFVAHPGLHPTPSCRAKTFIAGLFGDAIPYCALSPRVAPSIRIQANFFILMND